MTYRSEFFDFEDVAFLNCANQGPFPRVTVAAIQEALWIKTRPDRLRDDIYFRLPNEIRTELAFLLGGAPSDYAVTNGASDGLFAVARGLAWQRGDEVLVADGDFPANFFAWGNLASSGVTLRVLSGEGAPVTAAQFISALGNRTRVVCVSMVSYTTGYRIDIERLGKACRENGTLLVADITQAAGALELDLGRLPVDVAVCAAYKWLLSPYGTGFAWFHPDVVPRLTVTDVYWQAVEGAEDFNRLPRTNWKLAPGARRFDSTETASFLNGSAMLASLRFLRRVGVSYIERYAKNLLDRLLEQLPATFRSAAGLDPSERSTVLAIAGREPGATRRAFEALLAERIIVSLRDDRIRISPHIYNSEEQMCRCADILARV
jgi:cysteine desulfurase / selenocysteine lyase